MAKARKKQGSCHPALRTLILCQGEVTEKIYFDEMRKLLRWSAADIKCAAKDPCTLVKKASSHMKNKDYDRVFIIVDHDDTDRESLNRAAAEVKKSNFNLIISHSCFEVWLLAHYEKVSPPGIENSTLVNKLVGHGCYAYSGDKKPSQSFPYHSWKDAENNLPTHLPNEVADNPSTAVPYVIRALIDDQPHH